MAKSDILRRAWRARRIRVASYRSSDGGSAREYIRSPVARVHARGAAALKISIRDFHSNEGLAVDRGAPPRGFQFHANRRPPLQEASKHRRTIPRRGRVGEGWGGRARRAASRRVACLLLKCLHRGRSVGRNTPDIADFSSTAAGNARPFTENFCPQTLLPVSLPYFFLFLHPSSPSSHVPRAYESRRTFFFFPSSMKGSDSFPLRSLFLALEVSLRVDV